MNEVFETPGESMRLTPTEIRHYFKMMKKPNNKDYERVSWTMMFDVSSDIFRERLHGHRQQDETGL